MGNWLKNLFIPHEGNGHKPHVLRPRVVAFACVIALVAELGFVITATYVVPRTKFFGIIDANALVDETNAAREESNLPDLTVSPLLTQAAQDKVNDMVANNYFAHTSPSGITPWYWFEQVGYAFSYAGENLAVNFTDSQDVTDAWMNSPEHRANILDTDYTQVGIATAQGTYDGQPATYVAEEFGTPASQPIAFLNSAAAASAVPPAPASSATTTAAQPASNTVVVTTTASTLPQSGTVVVAPAASAATTATKPKTVPAVPAVVRSSTVATATAQPVSIVVPAAALTPTGTTATATPAIQGGTIRSAPQTNALQRLISNPAGLTDDFYFVLIALFAAAIILNFFVKIQVQFPHLILGGMLVIVVAGLLVLYNQNLGILHAVIL